MAVQTENVDSRWLSCRVCSRWWWKLKRLGLWHDQSGWMNIDFLNIYNTGWNRLSWIYGHKCKLWIFQAYPRICVWFDLPPTVKTVLSRQSSARKV